MYVLTSWAYSSIRASIPLENPLGKVPRQEKGVRIHNDRSMANLRLLNREQLVGHALLSSQNAVEVLRFLQNFPDRAAGAVEAIGSSPHILSELVQEAFFGLILRLSTINEASTRQFLFHVLDLGRNFNYPRTEVALKQIVATKNMDSLAAVMMLARGTPQAVVNYVVQRFALREKKVFGEAQVARVRFLKLMVDLCGEGEIEWHNNYVSTIFSLMLYDQSDAVVALIKASPNLPRPIVEAVLEADLDSSPIAVREVRTVLMQKPGWWTDPATVMSLAAESENPDGVLSDYIGCSGVDVQNRIHVLENILGLQPENPGVPKIKLTEVQLGKVVGVAARQDSVPMFQLCLSLLQGQANVSGFISILVLNLTSNPIALQRTAEIMQLLRRNQLSHLASKGFLKHYRLIYKSDKPVQLPPPAPEPLSETPTEDSGWAPVRPYRRNVLTWYQEAMIVESKKRPL